MPDPNWFATNLEAAAMKSISGIVNRDLRYWPRACERCPAEQVLRLKQKTSVTLRLPCERFPIKR